MHGKGKLSFVRKLNQEEFSQYLSLQSKSKADSRKLEDDYFTSPSLGYDPYSTKSQLNSRKSNIMDDLHKSQHTTKVPADKVKFQSLNERSPRKFLKHNESPVKKDLVKKVISEVPTIPEKDYDGDFFMGEMCGHGRLFNSQGRLIFEGKFKDSRPEGSGIEYFPDGKIYEGDYSEGVRSGHGKVYGEAG